MKRWIAVVAMALLVAAPLANARDAILTWTATGDDATYGRATSYELRYKSIPVAGTDTLTWWNSAGTITTGTPGLPGARDSGFASGLDSLKSWYFCIRVVDDAWNRSGFSNIAVLPPFVVRDTIAPSRVTGLSGRWR